MKFRNSIYLVIGAIFLGLPFVLKTIARKLEPYPAIVFPAGSTLVNASSTELSYNRRVLIGYERGSGRSVEIDPAIFLKPIPKHFFPRLQSNDFGLWQDRVEIIRPKYIPIPDIAISLKSKNTSDVSEAKEWFKGKLNHLGLDDQRFKVIYKKVYCSLEDGTVFKEEVLNDKVYELY